MSKKALVVEDDSNIAELLRLYLGKDGFEVSIAQDGGKAVGMFESLQPDIVLLDIMLPIMDGWQVCSEIRKTSKVPIIMLTAKGETMDKINGLEMGADDYITKPFEVKELIARVHAVMRRSGDEEVSKEHKLEFDKLVINLDSYELIVDGKKIRKKWNCSIIWQACPTVSLPEISCWMKSGALITSAIPAPWTFISSVSVKNWKVFRTNGR